MTRLVGAKIITGLCKSCEKPPEEHALDGTCLLEVGVARFPHTEYTSDTVVQGFLDADDRLSLTGARVEIYYGSKA